MGLGILDATAIEGLQEDNFGDVSSIGREVPRLLFQGSHGILKQAS